MKEKLYHYGLKILKLRNKFQYRSTVLNNIKELETDFAAKVVTYNENRQFGYQPNICNAPYSSLYFGIDGYAYACCKNRLFDLGHIKEKTIREIWEGTQIHILRDKLANYEFGLGCKDCKEGICASKYANVMAAAYDTPFLPTTEYPERMDFELSATCNLACTMCDGNLSSTYRKHFHHLSPKKDRYDSDFVAQLDEYIPHLKKVNFLGGEPFLIAIYYEIWEKLIQYNPKCSINIQTNGHVLNNKVKTLLSKGKFSIGISLESIQKSRFESIRLYGNFDRFLENLTYFKAYCYTQKTHFTLAITPLRETIDELEDFVHFANTNKAYIYFNTITEPHNKAIWTLPAKDIKNILDTFQNTKLPTSNHIEQANAHQFYSYYNQIKEWYNDAIMIENSIKLNQQIQRIVFVQNIVNKCINDNNFNNDLNEKMKNYLFNYINNIKDERLLHLYYNIEPSKIFFEVFRNYNNMGDN